MEDAGAVLIVAIMDTRSKEILYLEECLNDPEFAHEVLEAHYAMMK